MAGNLCNICIQINQKELTKTFMMISCEDFYKLIQRFKS